ncbi:MAG: hypothetical protein GY768_17310 [Planctomycetaceae bacterium]|nr:hypothetical protein [Planctomycetaceae bacterium]
MELVFALLLASGFVVLWGVYGGVLKRHDSVWESASRELGLSFKPQPLFGNRSIRGKILSFEVVVETFTTGSSDSRQTNTRFHVLYPAALGLGLRLKPEGVLGTVTKFFGAQDIELGDGEFDSAVMVKGANPILVQDFLTPARRLRIHRFFQRYRLPEIDDQGVYCVVFGVPDDKDEIVRTIRSVTRLAWHLSGERESDTQLDRAMRLQNEGQPEEAMEVITATLVDGEAAERESANKTPGDFLEALVEEKEMLVMLQDFSGTNEAANDTVEDLGKSESGEQKMDQSVGLEEPQDTQAATKGPVDLEVKSFCDDLFAAQKSSHEVGQAFDEKYQGQQVSWAGELQKVDRNYSSFIFKETGGLKATFKIDERPSPYFGTHNVLAVVHFDAEAAETLRLQIDQRLNFRGTLVKVDGLMRNVYLEQGQVIEE